MLEPLKWPQSDEQYPVRQTADLSFSPTPPEQLNDLVAQVGSPRLSVIPEERMSEVLDLSDEALFADY